MARGSLLLALIALAAQSAHCAVLSPRHDDEPTATILGSLEPKVFKDLGAKRVKISYGPFIVPSASDEETHGMQEFQLEKTDMPCNDCLITSWQPGLEFLDGSTANADQGMWLHHVVFFNMNRTDVPCSRFEDRFAAAGNERTVVDVTLGGKHKAGYYVGKNDSMIVLAELMNESQEAKIASVTVEWEYLPASVQGFELIKPVWLDVGGVCSRADVSVTDKGDNFNISTEVWKVPFSSNILTVMSHLHDGGIHQQFKLGGKTICDSVAHYGESAGYRSPAAEHGHEGHHGGSGAVDHISTMGACDDLGKVAVGDELSLTAFYNMTAHAPMLSHDGTRHPVMGIGIVYAARPWDEAMKEILADSGPKDRGPRPPPSSHDHDHHHRR